MFPTSRTCCKKRVVDAFGLFLGAFQAIQTNLINPKQILEFRLTQNVIYKIL